VNWTPWYWTRTNGFDVPHFDGVAYGNGTFVALWSDVGTGDNARAVSHDGLNWTEYSYNGPAPGAGTVTFGNGLFVAVGGGWNDKVGHAVIWTSADGVAWTRRADFHNTTTPSVGFTSVAYGGGQFVAVGYLVNMTNLNPMIYSSADGINWVGHTLTAGATVTAFGNGRFVGLAGSTAIQSGVIGKLGASLAPGGGVQGTITGVTGQTYAIQASTNLAAWAVLTNITVSTNGTALFNDPAGSSFTRHFYSGLLVQ
jgi:hypothetical protein